MQNISHTVYLSAKICASKICETKDGEREVERESEGEEIKRVK
jgi:hypothetical protein